jgi:hypothetical protein
MAGAFVSTADMKTVARLADLYEWAELEKHFAEALEDDVLRLARKTFAQPEHHDQLEWERKKAFYAGVDAVLALPAKQREAQRKESQ